MYLPSRKMQKVDELKIFRSVPHMINTDCVTLCRRTASLVLHPVAPFGLYKNLGNLERGKRHIGMCWVQSWIGTGLETITPTKAYTKIQHLASIYLSVYSVSLVSILRSITNRLKTVTFPKT